MRVPSTRSTDQPASVDEATGYRTRMRRYSDGLRTLAASSISVALSTAAAAAPLAGLRPSSTGLARLAASALLSSLAARLALTSLAS